VRLRLVLQLNKLNNPFFYCPHLIAYFYKIIGSFVDESNLDSLEKNDNKTIESGIKEWQIIY